MSREILRFATFEIVYVVIGTIYALCLYKLNRFLVESGIAENYVVGTIGYIYSGIKA